MSSEITRTGVTVSPVTSRNAEGKPAATPTAAPEPRDSVETSSPAPAIMPAPNTRRPVAAESTAAQVPADNLSAEAKGPAGDVPAAPVTATNVPAAPVTATDVTAAPVTATDVPAAQVTAADVPAAHTTPADAPAAAADRVPAVPNSSSTPTAQRSGDSWAVLRGDSDAAAAPVKKSWAEKLGGVLEWIMTPAKPGPSSAAPSTNTSTPWYAKGELERRNGRSSQTPLSFDRNAETKTPLSFDRNVETRTTPVTTYSPPRPKPVIAILVDEVPVSGGKNVARKAELADAVTDNGGQVRWLTNDGRDAAAQLEGVHGVLVGGGPDINPRLYGQEPKEALQLAVGPMEHDLWQCSMLQKAMSMRVPIRGIGRGMQMLNVAAKGTLMQDIRDHMQRPSGYSLDHVKGTHPIAIMPGTELGRQLKTELITLPSGHHQAIDRLGQGMQPVAVAADGVIEAIEKQDDAAVLGVQFQPQRASSEIRRHFFGAFVHDADRYQVRLTEPEPAPYTPPASSAAPVERTEDVPRLKTRDDLLRAGMNELEKRGLEIGLPAGGALVAEDLGGLGHLDYTAKMPLRYTTSKFVSLTLQRGHVHDFLLSLTRGGRELLHERTREIIELADSVKKSANVYSLGAVFKKKTGWLSKEQLNYPIEAAWALNEGSLHITTEYKSGPLQNLDDLRNCARDMHFKKSDKAGTAR